ncbi:MAG: hypothetical protein KatS3mg105_1075 [Gemmatales bacterium]|nr:MAG: hypothetical protein KatS3mg105_1075 [Gemmatales bacterium]
MGTDDRNMVAAWRWRSRGFRVAALVLSLVSLSACGFFMAHWLIPAEAPSTPPDNTDSKLQRPLFEDWPKAKPDVVILLSGQQYGYLQPCGCSSPQYGGLARRYNLIQELTQQRGWPVLAVDLGEIAQKDGPQRMLKYETSMKALNRMNYTAVSFGLNEMRLPLFDALAQYSLNNPKPRVLACNLLEKEDKFVGMVASRIVDVRGNGPRVGVIGAVGPSVVSQKTDPKTKFAGVPQTLPNELNAVRKEKAEVVVLLYQGSVKEAKACAAAFPNQIDVILCRSHEEEPPEKPIHVGRTLIVNVGHKGRYVGLVGVFRSADPQQRFDLRYQLVSIGPKYETPEGADAEHPIHQLLEEYAKEVKRGNYLAHYRKTKHPIQLHPKYANATYVGSHRCKSCHKHAYKIWEESGHAHAFASLESSTRPSLRQFDGECVKCHVVGFDYVGGYENQEENSEIDRCRLRKLPWPGQFAPRIRNRQETGFRTQCPDEPL